MIQSGDVMSEGLENGVRNHCWFRIYHPSRAAEAVLCGVTALLFWTAWPGIVYGAGLFFLSWEAFEAAYAFGRYGRMVPKTEDVVLIGKRLYGDAVGRLHLARAFVGAALMMLGRG